MYESFTKNRKKLNQQKQKRGVYIMQYQGVPRHYLDTSVYFSREIILLSNLWYKSTFVGNKIVDHSDAVGASPVGAAPTTSSFST